MRTLHKGVAVLAETLIKMERCGLYEEALAELTEIWADTSEVPSVAGMTAPEGAEIFLRCGSLIGFWGHNRQIKDSQIKAKNLLTEAHRRFLLIGDSEKIAECENYLALSYWRTGEINEAETFIEEALSHDLPISSETRIYAQLTKSLIHLSRGRNEEVVEHLKRLETEFRAYGDAFLNGSFSTNLGVALKNLGKTEESLRMFELARFYHQKSRHKIYLGTVENNLAQLYRATKQFARAHRAIDNGTKIFRQLKDRTREGFSFDTKALIYCEEEKFVQALETVEKAVEILRKSENFLYRAETHLTKAKILLRLNDFTAAIFALFEAVKIARENISEETARKFVGEFENALTEKNKIAAENSVAPSELNAEEIELIVPAVIAQYGEIQAVRIKNAHLENIGLSINSLAIVANVEVKRGDLTAVCEKDGDEISCGFFDREFGIVCLEIPGSEPLLYDEEKIEILGKIVGVGRLANTTNGKIAIEPLNL